MKFIKFALPIILLAIPFVLFAQNNFTHLCKMGIGDVADEDPNLAFFMLAMLCVIILACIFGAIFMVVLVYILSLCIIVGIVSTSIFVGFYKRSATKGFRLFMVLIGAFLGGIIGVVFSFVDKYFLGLHILMTNSKIYFFVAGLIGGALVGLTISAVLKRACLYFKKKLMLITDIMAG